ncbi:MAG: folate-binding protein [Mizugakiibacter sp.]|uniref:CAF17-like 4Fe-4S cluster assembly/insertion protein YgfZ n=1 Tax=Mizugakiibacter sp. TaxID=1972610 RepID=UPI0031C3CEDA|nr:folate-binding protein [Xanthomonadaceae bacterium]
MTAEPAAPADLGPAEAILIEGADASAFAHAQFASDVRALGVARWQWSAWLDAQGRVRALFQLGRLDAQRYIALLRGGAATALSEALRRYVLRAKVALTPLPAHALAATEPLDMHALRGDGDAFEFGLGARGLRVDARAAPADFARAETFRLADVRAGWPWLPAAALDAYVPQALGLQQLGAIALDKGCYPGQEIVARLHYRGGLKRQLWRIGSAAAIAPGATLRHAEQPCGVVLNAAAAAGACEALAVVHRELPPDTPLLIDDSSAPATLLQRFPP